MCVRMLLNVCLCPWVCIDSSIRIDAKVEARRCRHFIPQPFLPSDSHGVHVDVSVLWAVGSPPSVCVQQTNVVGTHRRRRFEDADTLCWNMFFEDASRTIVEHYSPEF